MDPMVTMNEANTTSSYNMATEIWPFPVTNNANAASFVNFLAANMNMSMNMNMNMNVTVNGEHDPMVRDHGTSNGAARVNLRKRREDDEAATKGVSTSSSGNAVNENDSKRLKTAVSSENRESEPEEEGGNSSKAAEQNGKQPEPPKQDYIHVRARRGQATDSHSLAERARREKISERMKILQELVPGCNKVIGKALVLDEIINYIQSLQHQVEFLSMKLEAVNSRGNPGIEAYPSKEFGQQAFDTSGMAFSSQATRDYGRGTSPEWLHMQLGGGFERTT